jgi:hypothetical protein
MYFFDAQFLYTLLHDTSASTAYPPPPPGKTEIRNVATVQLASVPEPMRFVWGSFNPYATLCVDGMASEMHAELQEAFLKCTQEPQLAVAYFESATHFLLPIQPDNMQARVMLIHQGADENEYRIVQLLSREQAFVAARVSHRRLTHSWVGIVPNPPPWGPTATATTNPKV